jgi:hypothetical protein
VSIYPSVDESFDRLHRAGWSIGEIAGSALWVVTGTNGENVMKAELKTQAEAWYRATLRAEAVGMLAPSRTRGFQALGMSQGAASDTTGRGRDGVGGRNAF